MLDAVHRDLELEGCRWVAHVGEVKAVPAQENSLCFDRVDLIEDGLDRTDPAVNDEAEMIFDHTVDLDETELFAYVHGAIRMVHLGERRSTLEESSERGVEITVLLRVFEKDGRSDRLWPVRPVFEGVFEGGFAFVKDNAVPEVVGDRHGLVECL